MPPSFVDEGLRAAIEIRRRTPEVALLVLSQYVEERYAADLISQGTRGVGYLLKDRVADVTEFLPSLQRVQTGVPLLTPRWWRSWCAATGLPVSWTS